MVKPKKHLGQHFLKDIDFAEKTAAIAAENSDLPWLEIGPGTGVLTQCLLDKNIDLQAIELDRESVQYLHLNFPNLHVIEGDFLKIDWETFPSKLGVIGNFPYNISSQIVFKILENIEHVPVFCGMFQLEVAQRLAAEPGSKTYGILSVLAQAYFDITLCFQIPPSAFIPPPKVQSAIISAKQHNRELGTDYQLFRDVVKTAFQQRRKMLSNALKKFNLSNLPEEHHHFLKLRAENLSVHDFVVLTNSIRSAKED